jgi:hypothetical protein
VTFAEALRRERCRGELPTWNLHHTGNWAKPTCRDSSVELGGETLDVESGRGTLVVESSAAESWTRSRRRNLQRELGGERLGVKLAGKRCREPVNPRGEIWTWSLAGDVGGGTLGGGILDAKWRQNLGGNLGGRGSFSCEPSPRTFGVKPRAARRRAWSLRQNVGRVACDETFGGIPFTVNPRAEPSP